MPTSRPRFQVTETPAVQRALQVAASVWPESSRAENVLRLLQVGADALDSELTDRRTQRLAAIDAAAGSLTGVYERGYLEKLREDWPA